MKHQLQHHVIVLILIGLQIITRLAELYIAGLIRLVLAVVFLLDPRLSQISPWVTLGTAILALGLLGLLAAGLFLAALTTRRRP